MPPETSVQSSSLLGFLPGVCVRQAHRNRDDAKELMAEEKPTALMAAPEAASLELSAGTAGSWTSEKASSRHLCLLPTTKPQQLFTALLSWAGGGEQPGESHWFQFSQDLRGLFFFFLSPSSFLEGNWETALSSSQTRYQR